MSNNFHLMVKKYFGEKEITHTSHSQLAGVAKSFASHISRFSVFCFSNGLVLCCVHFVSIISERRAIAA